MFFSLFLWGIAEFLSRIVFQMTLKNCGFCGSDPAEAMPTALSLAVNIRKDARVPNFTVFGKKLQNLFKTTNKNTGPCKNIRHLEIVSMCPLSGNIHSPMKRRIFSYKWISKIPCHSNGEWKQNEGFDFQSELQWQDNASVFGCKEI